MVVCDLSFADYLPCTYDIPLGFSRSSSGSNAYTNTVVIDEYSTEHLAAVEREVNNELASTQIQDIHPHVSQILPLSSHLPRPLLMADVARVEQLLQFSDDSAASHPHRILSPAIDMERYAEFGDEDDVDYDRLYTSLSYGILRERNSRLLERSFELGLEAQRAIRSSLDEMNASYDQGTERKRQHVDDINSERQLKQAQFQPVAGYLEMRWQSGIQTLVDRGISKINESTSEL